MPCKSDDACKTQEARCPAALKSVDITMKVWNLLVKNVFFRGMLLHTDVHSNFLEIGNL